jgi:cytochrome c oxidase cbb3-type subunit 3
LRNRSNAVRVFTAPLVIAAAVLMLSAAERVTVQAPNGPTAPAGPGGAAPSPQSPPIPPQRRGGGGGRTYPTYEAGAVERGQKQFLATCGFCHGSNAKGGESGPDLLRSVLVLDDDHGDKIGPVILHGRPDKGMPKFDFTNEQISDISAFLLDRIKAAALRGTYQILNIVVGDPKAGQAYFEQHCTSCHSATGDLAHIAAKYSPVDLQQRIVMPRQGRSGFMQPSAPEMKPITVTVTLRSGQSFSGNLERIDDFNVSLTDANGDYHSFTREGNDPKVATTDPLKSHTEMLSKYTDADIHNLTAYLVTLK